jgi:hypothetical protein
MNRSVMFFGEMDCSTEQVLLVFHYKVMLHIVRRVRSI